VRKLLTVTLVALLPRAFKPGRIVTAFLMKSGKVRAVVVGLVLD
jgi:hypothetical protein